MPEAEEKKESTREGLEEFLKTARKRFDDSLSDEREIRDQATLDLRFVAGDQWDEAVKNDRVTSGRPAMTFNRCHTFVQQVSNEARQNKPQIKFIVGDGGDKDTADVKEGMARHIQYASDAQIAYETAVEYSAGGSFGFVRVVTDYVDDESWDQEIKILPVFDPFSVYGVIVPSCFGLKPQFAHVVEEIPVDDYKRQFDTEEIDYQGWDYAGRESEGWIGTDVVRVAEYWWIEYETKELKKEGRTRIINKPTVYSCKTNGFEILKGTKTKWPGTSIPIVPVLGKQIIVDGKPSLFSVVRFQRDPQQLINFYKTRIAETMGTQPIQPYIIYEGQMENHESEWTQMAVTMRPWLTIKPVYGQNGELLPKPERQVFEAPIQALSEAAAQEIDDMKATTGIYDASLGAKSNEASGIALQRRQQQSNITNMHFMDNLERAFKQLGLIIAEIMPTIYDTERMVRILGPDEAPKVAKINAAHVDENGNTKHFKVADSSKDVPVVTMGRAFSTKRMESFDMMTQVLQTSPNLLPMIGDIFFKNSDLAGADQLAERFKKMLPPNLQDNDKNDPAAQAQALQAQLEQAHQVIQVGHQHIQQLEQEKQAKVVENQTKAQIAASQDQTKIMLAKMEMETKLAIAEISTKAQIATERATIEADIYKQLHSDAHEAEMGAQDRQHQQAMAEQGHQQALEQQDQAGQQQAALADQQAQNQQGEDRNV
jgi:hypothetical protein